MRPEHRTAFSVVVQDDLREVLASGSPCLGKLYDDASEQAATRAMSDVRWSRLLGLLRWVVMPQAVRAPLSGRMPLVLWEYDISLAWWMHKTLPSCRCMCLPASRGPRAVLGDIRVGGCTKRICSGPLARVSLDLSRIMLQGRGFNMFEHGETQFVIAEMRS